MITVKADGKDKLLDKSFLTANNDDVAVGLIKRIALKKDTNKNNYLSVLVKDVNGKTVFGCLFDVEASESMQREIEALTNRVAKIEFHTQALPGRRDLSLDISRIEQLPARDALELEKAHFKDFYPQDKFESAKKFINSQIDSLADTDIVTFLKSRCNIAEVAAYSDQDIYDGMVGAPISMIAGMLVAVNSVFMTQPGVLEQEDKEELIAISIYMELLHARMKPQHGYHTKDWYVQMVSKIEKEKQLLSAGPKNKSMIRILDACTDIVWNLAGVDVVTRLPAQVFLYLHRSLSQAHRIINITQELPNDAVISFGNKYYAR